MSGGVAFGIMMRFRVLEAFLGEWSQALSREEARKRLGLVAASPDVKAAALAWFDLRWPEEPP